MDKADKATEIIAEKRKLPEKIKDKLDSYTFINLLISIALMIYMIVINVLYLNENTEFFTTSIKIFSMLLIVIDIAIFEIGYRKDNISIWIHAVELLICSTLILSLQYIYLYGSFVVRNIFMLLPVFFSIYYVAKVIVGHVVETKKYQNNLSDIKELVKDEEEGYLDDVVDEIGNEIKNIEEMKNKEKEIIKKAKKDKKKQEAKKQ